MPWHPFHEIVSTGGGADREYRIIHPDGSVRWLSDRGFVVCDEQGRVQRIVGIAEDITSRKLAEERLTASLKEKEVLIKEVHHRVKNNMQIISSLLRLQSRYVKDKKILEALRESHNRIKAMTMVHELLYKSEDMARINLRDYFKAMAHNLYRAYGVDPRKISLNIEVADIFLRVDLAIPCGLVINELLSNSLKHAFPGDRCGYINLMARHINGNEIEIEVCDNGVGMLEEADWHGKGSLGLQIVNLLIQEQLKGHITLHQVDGTRCIIHVPIGETR